MKKFFFKKNLLVIFIIFIYFFLFIWQRDKAIMQDLGRHIKLGQIILSCRCLPKTNLLSYTEPNFPFVNHHWLSEVIFSLIYKWGGLNLIISLKIILISFIFIFLLYQAKNKSNSFWVFLFSPLYIIILSERFDARPEIFSFLFFIIFLFLINLYRKNNFSRAIYVLPLLEVLWVNLHIYFILGPILLGILFFENIWQNKTRFDRKILIIFLFTLVATFLNPNFAKGAFLPFYILRDYGYSIVENQNIFFLNSMIFNPKILVFEFTAVLLIFAIIFNFKKLKPFEILGSFFFTFTAVWQIRNFPLFALFTFPVITAVYADLDFRLTKKYASFLKSVKLLILILTMIFMLTSLNSVVSSPLFGFGYLANYENGVNFIINNRIKGPIFNNFDIGSYLTFVLYPQEKVFVDGRPEAYPVSFFAKYKKMEEDPAYFEKQAESYRINLIAVSASDMTPWGKTFLRNIIHDSRWVIIYYDSQIVVLVKNSLENKSLIDKFR